MLIVSTTGATNISDEHEAQDGVFDVPAELAEHLLQFPGWRQATEQEAVKAAESTSKRASRSRSKS